MTTAEIIAPKVLHITLKKQWFDMIASGEKKEEYRELKEYWVRRLLYSEMPEESKGENKRLIPNGIVFDLMQGHNPEKVLRSYRADFNSFDNISANNGYAKDCPNVKWEHKGIRIGTGKPEWGASPGVRYFILEIGEILTPANVDK